jgi:arginyl-tRNA synthetase
MSLEDAWSQAIRGSAKRLWGVDLEGTLLEPPADPRFGDATCNAAMRLAKQLKKPPRAIAEELATDLRAAGLPRLAKVEVAGAGFVNLTAAPEFHQQELQRILDEGPDYGRSKVGAGRRVLVEHCSANPTGPLHIAHGRQAAVGDSLANVLDFAGFKVGREFYINDTGNQIEMLGRSILWRMYEAEGRSFTRFERGFEEEEKEGPDGQKVKVRKPLFWLSTEVDGRTFEVCETNAYKGDYIKDLVAELKAAGGPIDLDRAKRYGKDRLLEAIKKDLETFRVRYDTWYSEESLHRSGKVDEVLNFFTSWGLTFQKDGATFLKTSQEGDPADRAIVKSDGAYVYRLPDMTYHRDKYARGFDILIDLWGPDHHAHIATMKAGMTLLNFNLQPVDQVRAGSTLPPEQKAVAFEVLIIDHCRLFQGGEERKMSKRAASYITLRELMEEVGVDATRFFFIMRKASSKLDFDMDVAVKQSKDNPVYYVQYAHARICSIYRKGIEKGLLRPEEVQDGVWSGSYDASKLGPEEFALLRAARGFQRRLEIAARDLDPAAMAEYLREVSSAYQSYYQKGDDDESKRVLVEDEALRRARLAASAAIQRVLRNGFRLLGISAPEQM